MQKQNGDWFVFFVKWGPESRSVEVPAWLKFLIQVSFCVSV